MTHIELGIHGGLENLPIKMIPVLAKAVSTLQSGKGKLISASTTVRTKANFLEQLAILKGLPLFPKQSQDALVAVVMPKTWAELASKQRSPGTGNLQRALTWNTALQVAFSHEIGLHRNLRKSLENSYLRGEFDLATSILDAHSESLGKSLWELRWRIAIADATGGDAGRRQFVEGVCTQCVGSLSSSFAKLFSHLFDDAIPPHIIRSTISSVYEEHSPTIRAFFQLAALGDWTAPAKLCDVIESIEVLPLIDRYILFYRVLTRALSGKEADGKVILRSLNRAASQIDDETINTIMLVSGAADNRQRIQMSASAIRIWNSYVSGEYQKVIDGFWSNVDITDLSIIDLAVKSKIYLSDVSEDPKSPLGRMMIFLGQIYNRTKDFELSAQQLDQMALKLPLHSISIQLGSLVSSIQKVTDLKLETRAALSSSEFSPRMLENCSPSVNVGFLLKLANDNPEFKGGLFFKELSRDFSCDLSAEYQVPPIRVAFFRGLFAFKASAFAEALKFLNEFLELQKNRDCHALAPFAINEAKSLMIRSYEKLGDGISAQRALVQLYLEHPNGVPHETARRIYSLCNEQRSIASKEIEFSILASIVADDPHEVSLALKRFMRDKSVKFPHQFALEASDCSQTLCYFIQRVCTMDVLDSLPLLDRQEKVEAERLTLLQWISENFPSQARSAENEKLRIIQEAQLRAALTRIDENKVVLNLSSLREAEWDSFAEIFSTYRSQRELAEHQVENEINNLLERFASSETKVFVMDVKDAELQIFKSYVAAFQAIRDKFLRSPHFGIEACLSGKIRHGILVEHLLKPLKSKHLFVSKEKIQRDDAEGYWRDMLPYGDPSPILRGIIPILEQLTNRVTSLAREVKDEWIQTRVENQKGQGLFDYSFDQKTLMREYENKAVSEGDCQRFLDHVMLNLSARTRANLETIRKKIANELRSKLGALYSEAITEIQQVPDSQAVRTGLVAARQDTETACEEMGRWFANASGALADDFSLELVGATSIGMVERLHPDIKEGHQLEVETLFRVKGKFFDSLVHLLFFLLENGVKHSSVSHDHYGCVVRLEAISNRLLVEVINRASNEEEAVSAANRINERIADLRKNLDPARIIKEGGSGFAKIMATVIYEFGHGHPTIEARADGDSIGIKLVTKMEGLVA